MARVDPVDRVLNPLTLLHKLAMPLTGAETDIVNRIATGSTPYPDDEEAQRQAFTSDRRTTTTAAH